jgi:hypothetical protein
VEEEVVSAWPGEEGEAGLSEGRDRDLRRARKIGGIGLEG